MQLDEVREQYKIIARSANSRAQQRKLEFLEHNLEQLSAVQKQLVEQNTSFKKEVAESQRKLMSRNDRIQNLEAALSNADQRLAQKNQKYEQQIQLFREKLAEGPYPFLTFKQSLADLLWISPSQAECYLCPWPYRQTSPWRRWCANRCCGRYSRYSGRREAGRES